MNAVLSSYSSALNVMRAVAFDTKSFIKGIKTGTTGTSGAPPAGAAWICVGSSNGASYVAASTTIQTDYWTDAFDSTKLVRAAAGVAHSWIVMKSPTGISSLGVPLYLLISLGTDANTKLVVRGALTAFTGGTLTADPTSVDETDFTIFNTVADVTAAASRAHYVTDANGNFSVYFSRNSQGYFHTMIGFQTWTPLTGDAYPFTVIFDSHSSTRGAAKYDGLILGQAGANTSGGCSQRSPDGSTASADGSGAKINQPDNGSWGSFTTLNAATGKHDAVAAVMNFRDSTGTIAAIRGTVPDWWVCNSASP